MQLIGLQRKVIDFVDFYEYGTEQQIQAEINKIMPGQSTRIYLSFNRLNSIWLSKIQNYLCSRKLRILLLNNNNLSNITIFKNFELCSLEYLNLDNNLLTQIPILNAHKLSTITAQHNMINNIETLAINQFKCLKELNFFHNHIENIEVFQRMNLKQIEILILGQNEIVQIQKLCKLKLQRLRELDISNNRIINMDHFVKAQFLNKLSNFEYACYENQYYRIRRLEQSQGFYFL